MFLPTPNVMDASPLENKLPSAMTASIAFFGQILFNVKVLCPPKRNASDVLCKAFMSAMSGKSPLWVSASGLVYPEKSILQPSLICSCLHTHKSDYKNNESQYIA